MLALRIWLFVLMREWVFFFFKQKTAYELRISDWSSYVCSSDLLIVWVASEQPNSSQARAVSALIKRLLAVGTGDLTSPTPPIVRGEKIGRESWRERV